MKMILLSVVLLLPLLALKPACTAPPVISIQPYDPPTCETPDVFLSATPVESTSATWVDVGSGVTLGTGFSVHVPGDVFIVRFTVINSCGTTSRLVHIARPACIF